MPRASGWLYLLLPLLLAGGCGDDDQTISGPADPVDGGGAEVGILEDIGSPTDAGADASASSDTSGSVDTGSPPTDVGPVDVGTPDATGDCPSGPGCPCSANSECDTALCIEVGEGKQCAQKCVDSCPDGFACVNAGAGDVLSVCAPLFNWLCDPCTSSEPCKDLAVEQAACVDRAADGAFCGIPCQNDAICPQGYECKSVKSIEGASTKQCVPKPVDASDEPGPCACSTLATKNKLSTACLVQSKNEKGELIASCPGVRTCEVDGLTGCIGPPPAAEKCNGADDDCDGQTDESTCDDGNPCTTDACDPTKAGDGKEGCVHVKVDVPCDADGTVCTDKDVCVSGVCLPGKALDCTDTNPCTQDSCDAKTGCKNVPAEGKGCDDGDPCTTADTCAASKCIAGPAKSCPATGPCILGQCDPTSGGCAWKKLSASCNDGNACTQADACDDGFCTGKAVNCDDNNPCTADGCDKKTGCSHSPLNAPCDDSNKCTMQDACKQGLCVGLAAGATALCDDGNPCTTDKCDKAKGCAHVPNSALCNDGNPCTTGDLCKAAKCISGTNTCDCTSNADCAAKEDGDLCNGTLFCDTSKAPFTCQVNPATKVSCSKANDTACLVATCAAKSGKCALQPLADGKGCDADGSKCTVADACLSGVCKAGKAAGCDDDNGCTTDSCDKVKGCGHVALIGSCEDGDACTSGDHCDKAICLPGKPKNCDDGNVCTIDSCDKAAGCVHKAQTDKSLACYSGADGTKGVGTCKGGTRTCQADGKLGPCVGQVVPKAKESCDGLDDDCDGKTDVGCTPVDFRFVQGAALVSGGAGGGKTLRALVGGGGLAGSTTGDKTAASMGAYAWLRSWLSK